MVKNVLAHRIRSLLTTSAIAISIATVITLMTFAVSLKQELKAAIAFLGGDLIVIEQNLLVPFMSSIEESYIERIQQYEGIERVAGFLLTNPRLSDLPFFNLFGVRLADRDLYLEAVETIQGGPIQQKGDIELGIIASKLLAKRTGETVIFNGGKELKVVGIFETGVAYFDVGGVVSLEDAQKIINAPGEVSLLSIYLKPEAEADQVIRQIEADIPQVDVVSLAEFLQLPSHAEKVAAFAKIFSLIALIMGGIGVMNSMTLSVSERTRELGIVRAMGWSKAKVLRMMLEESLLLSGAGFLLGSLLGIGAIRVIAFLPAVKIWVTPSLEGEIFLIALGIALSLGLVGGAYPAYKAASLSPVEALRHE